MTFDPTVYQTLAATDINAAAAYLQATTGVAAGTSPVTSSNPPPQAQPQQGYSNPAAVTPAPQLANGSLEDFYNQPTSGGAPSITSKFFNKRPQGSWLQLTVLKDASNSDVRQQQTPQGIPQTFKDGRPKFVLVVKVAVTGSSDGTHVAEFPDGEGSLWVKGVMADELRRAMTAAGDPSGYPKGGAQIVMQSAGEKASRTPGFSATKLYTLQYAGPVAAAAEAIANPTTQIPSATVAAPSIASAASVPLATVTSDVPFNTTTAAPSPATATGVPTVNFVAPVPEAAAAPNTAALLQRLHGNPA